MKFKITMKDPDGVSESIAEAASDSTREVAGISDDEREELIESRREELNEKIKKWFEWGEYLTVEIDTEANTARVCEK